MASTSSIALWYAFDIRTGEVTQPPCIVPIKTYAVVVEDGRVMIEV